MWMGMVVLSIYPTYPSVSPRPSNFFGSSSCPFGKIGRGMRSMADEYTTNASAKQRMKPEL
jgi:hypothetical protein